MSAPLPVDQPALQVRDLRTILRTKEGEGFAVDGVSLTVGRGEVVGLVGESGSGKTLLARSIMRVLPPGATIVSGSIQIDGEEITTKRRKEMDAIRGNKIAYVPQDPSVALNPVYRVSTQIREVLQPHGRQEKAAAKQRVIDLLREVQIPDPARRARAYPHQLSGGMRQRVASSVALAARPAVLIADEPTTALDVTVQAAYLRMLRQIQRNSGLGVLFITHDLSLVRGLCHRVAVMYAGRIIETGRTDIVFQAPFHPYTKGLLGCLPTDHVDARRGQFLPEIPGQAPSLFDRPPGCKFYDRCSHRSDERCATEEPPLLEVGADHWAATFCRLPVPGGDR